MGRQIAIDLGTNHTRMYIRGKGLVVDEPSLVARSLDSDEVIAVGYAAADMQGRIGDDITVIQPIINGVIADFSTTRILLEHFVLRALGRWHLIPPVAMISVPSGATSTEQRAVLDVGYRANIKHVYLIPSGVAAALGAGLPIIEPKGYMIIDIGSETTEIGVMALGGVIARKSLRIGSATLTDMISRAIKRDYAIVLGRNSAEELKRLIGTVGSDKSDREITVRGRTVSQAKLATHKIHSSDLRVYIEAGLERIVSAARAVLEKTPPDLVSDIGEIGITLTGGGAQLHGLPVYLSQRLQAPCKLAQDPMLCGVKGAYIALTHLNDYKRSLLGI